MKIGGVCTNARPLTAACRATAAVSVVGKAGDIDGDRMDILSGRLAKILCDIRHRAGRCAALPMPGGRKIFGELIDRPLSAPTTEAFSGGAFQPSAVPPAYALFPFSAQRALRGVWQEPQWPRPSTR
jgi:hypothetical protein